MKQLHAGRRTVLGAGIFLALVIALGSVPQAALALSLVSVGNGAAAPDGSYLNAGNIANTLAFTNVSVTATSEVRFVDPINLGTSLFGPTFFNLTNTAPATTILADIALGAGNFFVQSAQLDLSGNFTRVGGALNLSQLHGSATTVNVHSNSVSLQHALQFTNVSAGQSTVNAAFGTASSLVFSYDTTMILSGGLLSGSIAMNNTSALLQMLGYGFQIDTGAGFQALGTGSISALSGQLTGFLNSGNAFTVSFTQTAPNQISVVSSSVVPLPAAVWLFGSAIGLMGALRRKAEA